MIKILDEKYKQEMIDIANQNFTDELSSTLLLIDSINNKDYLFVGAFDNKILASYLIALVSLDDVCITSIATKDCYKKRGYAKQLIEYLKNTFKEKSISLEVKNTNIPAISLYEKLYLIVFIFLTNL